MSISKKLLVIVVLGLLLANQTFANSFPQDKLPDHIKPLTRIGQRAEWSLDGKKVMYLTRAGGEALEIDIKTRQRTPVTLHFARPKDHGYYRAMYLSNGDYLLTGGPKRHEAYLQIMDKSLEKPPVIFDEIVREGPAVSRTKLKIAWTKVQDKIWIADIVYKNGKPELANKKMIIDNKNVVVDGIKYEGMIEPQNFRGPGEKELIWAQYGNDSRGIFTSETFGYNLETGAIVNYSKAPNQYDEPEGIFPDGQYTLIECDKHNPLGTAYLELYMLKLDGTGKDYKRLTFFSEVKGFRASNPVVSDDGRLIAFQESISNSPPGAGAGIYLFDLVKAGIFKETQNKQSPAGFVSLFNGQDLTGWFGDTKGYIVQDGKIVCKKGRNLYTKDQYSDFVLRFEFKLTPGANNGLGIRTPATGDAAYEGMELQILDESSEKYANLKDYQHHGSIYGVAPAKRGYQYTVGKWNTQEVTANRNRIKVTLNGIVILDTDITEAIKNGTADHKPHPGLKRQRGHIAFLGHGDHVEFRNIRIKQIKN